MAVSLLPIPSLFSVPYPYPYKTKTKTKTLDFKPFCLSLKRRHLNPPFELYCAPPSLSPSPSPSPSVLVTHEDLNERDWSFVEVEKADDKMARVISSASLPPSSRVLVALPTPSFVDQLIDASMPQHVVAYHESLVMLSNVKELRDEVRCFQGGVTTVPTKFSPFDAVFVCYFPGMGVSLGQLLRSHASLCSSGSRVVIFFEQGRETIEIHRQQFPDRVTSDLPELETLKKVASTNGFELIEFVDEPTFYVAVLRLL
ncbi:hypothetical protein FCM35_KLT15917 [Carex littledalei]|uniref:Uncharacterized protein n=1 Tax=Carex littledalei TaxID=544730 RepID=A0A833RQP1_9POAL|nr:hypothetical protein FCM35_KLT15917 [Carex littledalei]